MNVLENRCNERWRSVQGPDAPGQLGDRQAEPPAGGAGFELVPALRLRLRAEDVA